MCRGCPQEKSLIYINIDIDTEIESDRNACLLLSEVLCHTYLYSEQHYYNSQAMGVWFVQWPKILYNKYLMISCKWSCLLQLLQKHLTRWGTLNICGIFHSMIYHWIEYQWQFTMANIPLDGKFHWCSVLSRLTPNSISVLMSEDNALLWKPQCTC